MKTVTICKKAKLHCQIYETRFKAMQWIFNCCDTQYFLSNVMFLNERRRTEVLQHVYVIIGGTDVLMQSQFLKSDNPTSFDLSCDPSQIHMRSPKNRDELQLPSCFSTTFEAYPIHVKYRIIQQRHDLTHQCGGHGRQSL